MTQTLVAVPAYRLPPGRVTSWHVGCFAVPEPYVQAVRRAGMTPVILPETDLEAVASMLDMFDAVLLLGGGDTINQAKLACQSIACVTQQRKLQLMLVVHEESLALSQELGDQLTSANTLQNLGLGALEQGEYQQAQLHLAACLSLCQELGPGAPTPAALAGRPLG